MLADSRYPAHRVACATHIGRTHQKNQDTGGAWTWIRVDGTPVSLAVVADGVSAGLRSEVASRLVVESIRDRLTPELQGDSNDTDFLLTVLTETATRASIEIAQGAGPNVPSADATTLTAAFCVGSEAAGVWCGDSRVYHLTAKDAAPLTRDHSWAENAVSRGLMTAEQAARDPRAHMITRWLGPQEEAPEVETFRLRLEPGEALLCCSDGFYSYFVPPSGRESEMARILLQPRSTLRANLDRLVHIALDRGGHDDITGAAVYSTVTGKGD